MIYFVFTACLISSLICTTVMNETKYNSIEECVNSIGPAVESKILKNKDKFIFAYCVEDLKQSKL
jgi:hypothetical protein